MRLAETVRVIEQFNANSDAIQAAIAFLMSLLCLNPKLEIPVVCNMGTIAFCWKNDIIIILSKPKQFYIGEEKVEEPKSLQAIVKLINETL